MVSNDPYNRKQPFILGIITLVSGILLALFVIDKVRANVPNYEDSYNYVAFLSIKGHTPSFYDASGNKLLELPQMYSGDGSYDVFEASLVNLFTFISPNESLIFLIDDLATKATYEFIQETLTKYNIAYVERGFEGIFPYVLNGFELKYYTSGMWDVPIYSRTNKVTPLPTATPTPTNAPDQINYVYLEMGGTYFLIDFNGSGVGSIDVTIPQNSVLSNLQSEYNSTSNIAKYFGFVPWNLSGSNTNRNGFGFWFNANSLTGIVIYMQDSPMVDFDYVRETGSPYVLEWYYAGDNSGLYNRKTLNNAYSYIAFEDSVTEKRFFLDILYYYNSDLNKAEILDSSFSNINEYVSSISPGSSSVFSPFSYTYSSSIYRNGLISQMEFVPQVNPLPTEAPPSPTPSPTEAPHVNINWPSGTPSPTPPFSVPGDLGSGSGSSSQNSLSPGQVGSTLNTFKQYTENNGAFAFLYACTSVIPDEALYFLFILLFVLLLIAVIRLFVHYGG